MQTRAYLGVRRSQGESLEVPHAIALDVPTRLCRRRPDRLFQHGQGGELRRLSQIEPSEVSGFFCHIVLQLREYQPLPSQRISTVIVSSGATGSVPAGGALSWQRTVSLAPPGRQRDCQDKIIVIPFAPGSERLICC